MHDIGSHVKAEGELGSSNNCRDDGSIGAAIFRFGDDAPSSVGSQLDIAGLLRLRRRSNVPSNKRPDSWLFTAAAGRRSIR